MKLTKGHICFFFFFRVSTANYAPIKYRFGSTTYQQHFQQRNPFTTAFVIPYSRHRNNNPQPNMVNSYNYPDGVSPDKSASVRSWRDYSRDTRLIWGLICTGVLAGVNYRGSHIPQTAIVCSSRPQTAFVF